MLDKSNSIFKTGTALYSLIRSYAQSTPIYLISVKTAPTNQIGEFDLFINNDAIHNHLAFRAEIDSHNVLKSCTSTYLFLDAIKCPRSVSDEIETMIKTIISDKDHEAADLSNKIPENEIKDSLNLRLFRWIARSLLRKEGPLVSKAGAAALLGISVNYFSQISPRFDSAKYGGIFSLSFGERWWASSLEDIIYETDDPDNYLESFPFKEAASKLLNAIEEKNISVCVKCGERYPDGLGIVSGQEGDLHPVHIYCSEFDETIAQEPFFRNPRIIEVD